MASVEAISRQEQERDKMLNDNQNELEKQNGEVKQKMEQLNAKFKEMEKTNLGITSQFKTITGKVDSTERTSKEEILKNKKSIIEWLEQDRAQLKEEILSLIETVFFFLVVFFFMIFTSMLFFLLLYFKLKNKNKNK